MATTPVYGLRYQEAGDAPDGAGLGANLAADVEAELARIDGGGLALADLSTAWADHSLAWTSSGTAPAIGTSAVLARYKQVGKLVHYSFRIDFAGATFGTGVYRISLPVDAAAAGAYFGTAWFRDTSAAANGWASGMCWIDGPAAPSYLTFAGNGASGAVGGQVTNAYPFTWVNTDILGGSIAYEAA